jgi:hypothetical protein
MNQLNERDIDQHVTILGWLYIVSNAILLPIGLCGLLFFAGIGFATADPTAFGILGTVGLVSVLFFAVLALPGLLAAYGLLKRRKWGYFLGIIMGFLSIINFPVGTAIGIYTLFVLFQDSANGYFAAQEAACCPD